jgi:hypothetical protein
MESSAGTRGSPCWSTDEGGWEDSELDDEEDEECFSELSSVSLAREEN